MSSDFIGINNDADGVPRLKLFCWTKKVHHGSLQYVLDIVWILVCFVGDIKDGNGTINKFNCDCLELLSEVNIFKEKYYKKTIYENSIFPLWTLSRKMMPKGKPSVYRAQYTFNMN